jgi:hypothetical protein
MTKTHTLKATLIAGVLAASSFLFLPSTAQAEASVDFYTYNDNSVMIVVVTFHEAGDFVQSGIIDFAYAHGVAIIIDAAPGLAIEEVDGVLRAVAF